MGNKSKNTEKFVKNYHQLKISVNKTFMSLLVLVFSYLAKSAYEFLYKFSRRLVLNLKSYVTMLKKTLPIISMSSSLYINDWEISKLAQHNIIKNFIYTQENSFYFFHFRSAIFETVLVTLALTMVNLELLGVFFFF